MFKIVLPEMREKFYEFFMKQSERAYFRSKAELILSNAYLEEALRYAK